MGGGSNEIKETAAEQAAADVANKQWDLYSNELKGFEDNFIQRVDNFNSKRNMDKTKQDTDLAYADSYGKSRDASQKQLASSGVDPTSQKYQKSMDEITSNQTVQQADTINRAQTAEQDKHVAGLQDVASIGMGQKSEALSGMGDVATASLRKATEDAQDDFNRRAANLQLAGAASGAGASYGLRNVGDASKTVKPVQKPTVPKLSTATHGVTQNGMQVSSDKYDPLGRTW